MTKLVKHLRFWTWAFVAVVLLSYHNLPLYAEGWIAFESTRRSEFPRIYVMSTDNGQLRLITQESSTGPAWSPDGQFIVCVRERGHGDGVYLVAVDWRNPNAPQRERILPSTRGFELISSPSFSPDGLRLTFNGGNWAKGEIGLYITDFQGTELQKAATLPIFDWIGPAWSPDGRTIAFVERGAADIFALDVETLQLRNITNSARAEMSVAWSPDGSQLAVSSSEGLLLMTPDGQVIEQLLPRGNGDLVGPGCWSPDGTRIAFTTIVRPGPKIPPEVYQLDLITRELTNLSEHLALDQGPVWFDTRFARPLAVSAQDKALTAWGKIKQE